MTGSYVLEFYGLISLLDADGNRLKKIRFGQAVQSDSIEDSISPETRKINSSAIFQLFNTTYMTQKSLNLFLENAGNTKFTLVLNSWKNRAPSSNR